MKTTGGRPVLLKMKTNIKNMQPRFLWHLLAVLIIFCINGDAFSRGLMGTGHRSSNSSHLWSHKYEVNIFWINMQQDTHRRHYMHHFLSLITSSGLEARLKRRHGPQEGGGISYHRVEAVSPSSPDYNLLMLEKPCKRNTPHDLSVLMSHLKAIHAAVELSAFEIPDAHIFRDSLSEEADPQINGMERKRTKHGHGGHFPTNHQRPQFALILEDDVRLIFNLDLDKLIDSAPHPFGILQLVTSNIEAINMLWSKFEEGQKIDSNSNPDSKPRVFWTENKWNDMTRDKKTTLYWSAQAYLVNLTHISSRIRAVVQSTTDAAAPQHEQKLGFKLVNSFYPEKCIFTPSGPCVLANCLFSDSYLYSFGSPTYVSHIPLFTGASVGLRSSVHQDQVYQHVAAFERIDAVEKSIREKYLGQNGSGSGTMGNKAVPFIS